MPAMQGMPMHQAKPAAGAHAGMRMERMKKLQTALNAKGASVTVDGKMGPKTMAALKTFQQAHGLKVTGHPDKETMAALMK
jgi:peptidoglycan hydrolase-like protein with peptidoglycan-binding domain